MAVANRMKAERATTIAILAMGGEGGGVLADWLLDLAESNGHIAQSTSVPGVAQRTGATIYYLELFPEALVPAGRRPVLALSPVPGEVDIVIASELMEAGRALQRGLVSATSCFIASSHRVYSMTERTALGDGRVDAEKLLAGARAAAQQFVSADFARLADAAGSPIGAALYGALAATGRLPFSRAQFEATIERGGVGVRSSLAAFAAGFDAARRSLQEPAAVRAAAGAGGSMAGPEGGASAGADAGAGAAGAVVVATPASPQSGPRLAALAQRIEAQFASANRATLSAGILRAADYQDEAYAAAYLDRLRPLAAALGLSALPTAPAVPTVPTAPRAPAAQAAQAAQAAPGAPAAATDATAAGAASAPTAPAQMQPGLALELFDETARHLALWLSYEDAIRVADLKTRRSRFERVAAEVRLDPAQQLDIHEFMHPRVEEIADVLPAALGRWLLATGWARAALAPFTRKGRVVHTSSIRGFLQLYAVAALRPLRRRSLRFQVEQQRIDEWLARIEGLSVSQPALALEVARAQRLVKGYGDTHARGWRNFQRLMDRLPNLQTQAQGAQRLQALVQAALADEDGQALDRQLAGV